ncbi:TetR family transcriptional regulator [Pseudonocardia sp. KRD291]|uniref:TetR family transcriptional regulator n=1 Tax=Pseudonocardia sp. KRD291 TaxID=2792007 RepID=UPI001C49E80F|nr:TetR family transcriptional regulator [Pseudonocardia sp. KRD291]MBW0102881.1 TetR family transcriptional regulator [Pseudonocardia sp. KRD291]
MTGGGHSADGDLGPRIRAARQARGTSLRGLAATLHVSPATLSQIENGNTGLSVSRLSRIAEALDLTVPQILDVAVGADPAGVPAVVSTPGPRGEPGRGAARARPDWREYGPLDFDPVLTAALEEFLDTGYHGATVRGIAARAGLSVSGIYHYYPSKQAMLVRILDLTMTDLLVRAESARAQGHDPVERFGLLVENLALFHTHRKELGFVGATEMRSFEAGNREKIAELRTVQQRMVDREVTHAVREGRFRSDRPHEAARAVVTMCTALPTWWRRDGPLSPEQVAEQYVGFALELMGRRGPG